MANVKITELTAATALAGTDVLPIVDVGADATKKVSVSDLLRNLPDGTASAPALAFADDQNTGLLSPGNNSLAFATSGTQRLVIDSSGRVGIGVASPARELSIGDGSGSPNIQLLASSSGNSRIEFGDSDDSDAGEIQYVHSSNYMQFTTNGSEGLRIDSSGRVLVGTTTPSGSSSLQVAGKIATLGLDTAFGTDSIPTIYRSGSTAGSYPFDNFGHLIIQPRADGAPRDIVFATGNGGTNKTVIDSSGNVGIGTASPSNNLDIAVGANSEGINIGGSGNFFGKIEFNANRSGADQAIGDIAYKWNGTRVARIIGGTGSDTTNKDDGALQFHTASAGSATEKVRIDGSGRVGIGTSSPNNNLTINQADSGNNFVQFTNSTTGTGSSDGGLVGINTAEQLLLWNYENDDALIGTNNTERMRIDSSGRLLVGTSTSQNVGFAHTVQIEGTDGATSSLSLIRNSADDNGPNIDLASTRGASRGSNTVVQSGDTLGNIGFRGADGSDKATTGASISAQVDGTPGSNDMPGRLVFKTTKDGASSPTERMRIDNAGKHSIYGDTNVLRLASNQGPTTAFTLIQARRSETSTTSTTGTDSFRVFCNGNVENSNNSYGGISDAKLKENIVDASSQWEDIKDIRVRNYNFIEGQTHTQLGVVAQEVETVSPGLVTESPDRDDEGNDLGTVTKSVNYSVLYMKAVKALQEAMDRIETLEAKVAALEAQ